MFFLLIASSPSIKADTCNSFPKIFGGSSGYSWLNQIDVFNDYLAMGGYTEDSSLIGTPNCYPYVALQSISAAAMIYWAKAFLLITNLQIVGVQFSTDGELLIVHTKSGSSTILVI